MHYEIILAILSTEYNIQIEQQGMDAVWEIYRNTQHDSHLLDIVATIAKAFKNAYTLDTYHQLKKTVLTHIDSFHPIEQRFCFGWLTTYFTFVTRYTKSNKRETDVEYLNLYKAGFQQKYLLNHKISAPLFISPFMVAGVLGDIEWCRYMIANYMDCVYDVDKSNVVFFADVYLNFVLENDEKVVELMQHKTTMSYDKNSSHQLLKFYLMLSLFRLKRFDELYTLSLIHI